MVKEMITTALKEILGTEHVFTEEPMSRHTSFRIGGPADYLVTPHCVSEVLQVLILCKEEGLPYFVLGNGSNLLVSDQGYEGLVLQFFKNWNQITTEGEIITAQSGALLSGIAWQALEAGLTGFEFAGGIPGTLGGAVVMNAGAYGGEMKDVLLEVTALTKEGKEVIIPAKELAMGYRTSLVKAKEYLVLEAKIGLRSGDPETIREKMRKLTEQRTAKQPLNFPSAGSTFKRPDGYFAGKLIMDAGLKGYRVGGAQVSEKHCGFVINAGGATAEDVRRLMADVQEKVKAKFGVTLEPEVKFLGEFQDR